MMIQHLDNTAFTDLLCQLTRYLVFHQITSATYLTSC